MLGVLGNAKYMAVKYLYSQHGVTSTKEILLILF